MVKAAIIIILFVSCGGNKTVTTMLDGTKSTGVVKSQWRQIGTGARIDFPGQLKTRVTFTGKGIYQFELTVNDISKDTVKITVKQKIMDHSHTNGSIFMMLTTFFLYITSYVSLSNVAAVATIIAALTTAGYNIVKIREMRKKKNKTI